MSRPKRAPALAGARFVFVQALLGFRKRSDRAHYVPLTFCRPERICGHSQEKLPGVLKALAVFLPRAEVRW